MFYTGIDQFYFFFFSPQEITQDLGADANLKLSPSLCWSYKIIFLTKLWHASVHVHDF